MSRLTNSKKAKPERRGSKYSLRTAANIPDREEVNQHHFTPSGTIPQSSVLALQQIVGNQSVQRLLNQSSNRHSPVTDISTVKHPLIQRLRPSLREQCYNDLANKMPSPKSKSPLTDNKKSYTLLLDTNRVSKRFVDYQGTDWMIMVIFNKPAFKNRAEAQRYIDKFAEKVYRHHLRYARNVKRQLCEQSDPKPLPDLPTKPRKIVVYMDKPTEPSDPTRPEGSTPGSKPQKPTKITEEKKPPKKPVPQIDNPIVIDKFPFNDWKLPKKGKGIKQLVKLCSLDAPTLSQVKIISIEGHTDRVPMKIKPSKRFSNLFELSDLRANEVRKLLIEAGITKLPKKNQTRSDSEAKQDRRASSAKRGSDRKVVVRWKY